VNTVEAALQKNPALANTPMLDDTPAGPLHLAAACGQAGVAAVLLKYGAKLDNEDERGVTPLLIASSKGDVPMIELFLKNNDPTLNKLVFQETTTAAAAAAEGGHIEALETLHRAGARLDIANAWGESALTATASKLKFAQERSYTIDVLGLTHCLAYLETNLGPSADISANVYTPLMRTAHDGDTLLAEKLLTADPASVNCRYSEDKSAVPVHGAETKRAVTTALKEAVDSRKPEMVELMLRNGAKQDVDYEGDQTPIMLAVLRHQPEMLKALLDNDASTVNALHTQIYEGFLRAKRVDFTHSALTYAVQSKDVDMVKLLLDHGARTDLPTTKSPLQLAEEAGLTEITALLKGQPAQNPAAPRPPTL
jgi:ankyrin repeat protein